LNRPTNDINSLDLDITNLSWPNSAKVHGNTGHGPLMLSIKTKNTANAVVDHNLTIPAAPASMFPSQCSISSPKARGIG